MSSKSRFLKQKKRRNENLAVEETEQKKTGAFEIRTNCVFYEDKFCPVRNEISLAKRVSAYVKPGDELAKMMDNLSRAFEKIHTDLAALADFCSSCPFINQWTDKP